MAWGKEFGAGRVFGGLGCWVFFSSLGGSKVFTRLRATVRKSFPELEAGAWAVLSEPELPEITWGKGVWEERGRGEGREEVVWWEERNDLKLKGRPTLIAEFDPRKS